MTYFKQFTELVKCNDINDDYIHIPSGEIFTLDQLIECNTVYVRGDHQAAFKQALKNGSLTENVIKDNWIGAYMYMHSRAGKDYFKNKNTRNYDVISISCDYDHYANTCAQVIINLMPDELSRAADQDETKDNKKTLDDFFGF